MILLGLLAACQTAPYALASEEEARRVLDEDPEYARRYGDLYLELRAQAPAAPPEEVAALAETALATTLFNADRYDLSGHPIWHNMMVNMGWRERGLCYHFAEDLLEKLQALESAAFDLHWGIAYEGSGLEHSCIVVTARGEPFETGVVLDGWRDSGRLLVARVSEDSWPWTRWQYSDVVAPLLPLPPLRLPRTPPRLPKGWPEPAP